MNTERTSNDIIRADVSGDVSGQVAIGNNSSPIQSIGLVAPDAKTTRSTFNVVGAQPGRWRTWAVAASGQAGLESGWWEFRYTH